MTTVFTVFAELDNRANPIGYQASNDCSARTTMRGAYLIESIANAASDGLPLLSRL
ncbi:MAG: hypothetical protein NC452_05725 [Eubacterium sp.]|nr:hypothetical protein [Eubacterium sp.]